MVLLASTNQSGKFFFNLTVWLLLHVHFPSLTMLTLFPPFWSKANKVMYLSVDWAHHYIMMVLFGLMLCPEKPNITPLTVTGLVSLCNRPSNLCLRQSWWRENCSDLVDWILSKSFRQSVTLPSQLMLIHWGPDSMHQT